MRFDFVTQPATFVGRPNRYLVYAKLEESGAFVDAHCADPGRLRELLIPGTRVHISPAAAPATAPRTPGAPRKTTWDLRFVEHPENGQLVSLDTRVPNRIFEEGWRAGFFPELGRWSQLRREVPHPAPLAPALPDPTSANAADSADGGFERFMATRKARQKEGHEPHSRADFLLAHAFTPAEPLALPGARCWVEVKSASLVVDGVARFPDAITDRGRRHMLELAALVAGGEAAAVVFIVQRPDADALCAHRATDPAFADALECARAAGVLLLAATCRLTTVEIHLDRHIPVIKNI